MDLDTYFKTVPEAKEEAAWAKSYGDSPDTIRAGVFEFNEETACFWGGPLPGNVALFILRDE